MKKTEAICAVFHQNPNLINNNNDIITINLTGILRIILIKYIAKYITNINLIKSEYIREIITTLKNGIIIENNPEIDIQTNLKQKTGKNIIEYTNYICSIIKDENDINNLLELVDRNKKNKIINFWSILSKYDNLTNYFILKY